MRRRYIAAMLAAGTLLLASGLSAASESAAHEDHEVALSALRRGEVMPARDIVDAARTITGNDVLRLELEREDGHWIYEIKYVDGTGRVRTLNLDARTGETLESDGD